METIDRHLCSMLWDGDDFEWVSKPAEGRSGGLLIIWNKVTFELVDSFDANYFLLVEGKWGQEKFPVTIMNLHAPCDLRGKREL